MNTVCLALADWPTGSGLADTGANTGMPNIVRHNERRLAVSVTPLFWYDAKEKGHNLQRTV